MNVKRVLLRADTRGQYNYRGLFGAKLDRAANRPTTYIIQRSNSTLDSQWGGS
jgi:hypothetical protein